MSRHLMITSPSYATLCSQQKAGNVITEQTQACGSVCEVNLRCVCRRDRQGEILAWAQLLYNPNRFLSFKQIKYVSFRLVCVPFKSLRECNLVGDVFTVEVPFAVRNNRSAH